MPTHINIETDFFEEDYNNPSETYQRQQSLLFNREKSAIIMENTLESSRLRRLIWAFRLISRDPAESRIRRKYSSGDVFPSARSSRKRHRQHTDSGSIQRSRQGFQSRSQSRVLTRKKSQSFHQIYRSEAKQSRKAILEGIRQKLQDHNLNKSKVTSSRIAQTNSAKKQSEDAQHLDRRIRKLQNLMRNIRRDKELNQPSIIHQKKTVQKMPKKETPNSNFKVFIEEIHKLREQVSELKQLNQTLVKSSRARSERSHLTTPRDSGIYANQVKNNNRTGQFHIASYNFRQHGKSHYEEGQTITKKSQSYQKEKVNTPKQFNQNSEFHSQKREEKELSESKQNKLNSYTVLINSIKSPRIPIGQDTRHHNQEKHFSDPQTKKQEIQKEEVKKEEAKKEVQEHINIRNNSHNKVHFSDSRGQQILDKKKQAVEQPKQERDNWEKYEIRMSEKVNLNHSHQKYSPLSYDLNAKRNLTTYDKYLERDSSTFDYKNMSGYSGNYTPGNGGYTNPELLKRLGFTLQSNSTLKSLEMIKNTSSQPYPQQNQKSSIGIEGKSSERKSIQDDLHTYRSSSFVYSQQTFSEVPENASKKQIQEEPKVQVYKEQQSANFKKDTNPPVSQPINAQIFHPQPQTYSRSHSSVPLVSNPSSASISTFQVNRPNNFQQMQQPSFQQSYLRPNNLSISKPNTYQKPQITFNRPASRF